MMTSPAGSLDRTSSSSGFRSSIAASSSSKYTSGVAEMHYIII